jgi:4-hydroxy-4-methyl-2-oxoglutarate aldolase
MIHDPPLLEIRRAFERAKASDIARLEGIETGWLIDAMNGRGALDHRIKPVDPERAAFVGSAITCACGPSDNLAIIGALSLAEKGDVILAATDGFAATAVIGDNLAAMGRNKGLAAMVTDGMARDSAGIEKAGLPVFAAGITPNSCVKSGPGTVGLGIVVGGVRVEAGDVIVGDRDGVVVIPRARLAEVLARLDDVKRAEAELQALASMPFMDEMLASDRVRFVD